MNTEVNKPYTRLVIRRIISIGDISILKPEHIYYGANTCWWTHDPQHLRRGSNGLPLDPCGGVLFYTDDVEGFLREAEKNPGHYGKHGLEAFVAAHHLNCYIRNAEGRLQSWASANWDDYNNAIDQRLIHEKLAKLVVETGGQILHPEIGLNPLIRRK